MVIAWLLTRHLDLAVPPPVSVRIAMDRGGYLSGLTLFRLDQVDPWVAWFAGVLEGSGSATSKLVEVVGELDSRWRARLTDVRSDAVAHRVLALLPAHPVLGAEVIAGEMDVSERAARSALETLAAHDVLQPFSPARRGAGRPRGWWVDRPGSALAAERLVELS